MLIPRACMLRFPLSSIQTKVKLSSTETLLRVYRPWQPELHFSFRAGDYISLAEAMEKYKKGYCHMCASFGELCKEGRLIKDRPLQ